MQMHVCIAYFSNFCRNRGKSVSVYGQNKLLKVYSKMCSMEKRCQCACSYCRTFPCDTCTGKLASLPLIHWLFAWSWRCLLCTAVSLNSALSSDRVGPHRWPDCSGCGSSAHTIQSWSDLLSQRPHVTLSVVNVILSLYIIYRQTYSTLYKLTCVSIKDFCLSLRKLCKIPTKKFGIVDSRDMLSVKHEYIAFSLQRGSFEIWWQYENIYSFTQY